MTSKVSDETPDEESFDETDFLELSVDGRSILRLHALDDALLSSVDEAAIIAWLGLLAEGLAEEIEEEEDVEPEELLERHAPEIRAYDSDDDAWETLSP